MNMTSHPKSNVRTSTRPLGRRLVAFWGNISLARKLLVSFGSLAVLAITVGVVANIGLNSVERSYQHAFTDGWEMQRISQQLSRNMLIARRSEKDFLLRWQVEGFDAAYRNYVIANRMAVAAITEDINDLSEFASTVGSTRAMTYPRSSYSADLNLLRRTRLLYEESFLLTVQLIQEKGFQDTGLEGELRAAVQNIEDRIYDREGLDPLVITMLQIRRLEEDYLLGHDQRYVDDVHQLVAELKGQIASSAQLSPTEKTEMLTLADQYAVAFDRVVEKDAEIALSIEALGRAARAMEPVAAKLANAGNDMSQIDIAAAQKSSSQTLIGSSITLVAVLFIALFLAITLARQLVRPIRQLTDAAHELESGNYDAEAQVSTNDEVGILAGAFNNMARNLKQSVALVTKRATELQSVAEIATMASRMADVQNMLQSVVDLTKSNYHLYHAHIYLLDDEEVNLVLAAGAGDAGRQMVSEKRRIALDRQHSLVARAARTARGVISNDITQEPDFLPNPLLPATRSELAVPMTVGDHVIGVFDVQSDVVGRFTESDIAVQTTLASQVAAAVHNARQYQETLEAQKLTRNVIDSTDDWIFIKDQNHRYRLVNQGYANSLHIPMADFIGKNDLELGFPEELVKGNPEKGIRGFWADDRSVMDGGVTKQIPDDLVTIDGELRVFDTVKVPLRDADNKVWGVLAFARDTTERRQLEELNRKRAIQQEAINNITQRIQSANTIEEAMQVTARELGHALGMKPTLVSLSPGALKSNQLGVPNLAKTE